MYSSIVGLAAWGVAVAASAQDPPPRLLFGSETPAITLAEFRGDPGADSAYNFPIELRYGSQAVGGRAAYVAFVAEAVAYPYLSTLEPGGDPRTQLAFTQAAWDVARFHAADLQARYRREVGTPRQLAGIRQAAAGREVIATSERAWERDQRALFEETAGGSNLLVSQAFSREFASALDTIRTPRLAESDHGGWLYFGGGYGVPLGDIGSVTGPSGAADLGLGYRYRRLRLGYHITFNGFRPREAAAASGRYIDDRASLQAVCGIVGVDFLATPRYRAIASGLIGGTELTTGSGDDQVDLHSAVAYGAALDLLVRLGKPLAPSADIASLPRSPFTLLARATALRQEAEGGRSGPVVSLTVGIYFDIFAARYTEG